MPVSKDAVKQMFGKIEKDAALKNKYAELMQAHQKDTEKILAEKLIELGKTSGFAFSNEDLLAARAEFADKANSNKELSEDDLANVAGGGMQKGMYLLISIGLVGVMCGLISISGEIASKGGCGRELSTTGKC